MTDLSDIPAILPKEGTSRAVQTALSRLEDRQQAIGQKLAELREARREGLLDVAIAPAAVIQIETEIRELEITLARLADLEPGLQAQLEAARQAEQRAWIDRLIADANEAIEALRVSLADYPEAAARVVQICRKAEAALTAVNHANTAARQCGIMPRFEIPGGDFGRIVRLPGVPGAGTGLLWGRMPAPEPVIRY